MMENTSRKLKVYSTLGKPAPKICLQGKWVEEVGFSIGDYIEVVIDDNRVIITKITEPKKLPTASMKTTVSKPTIDVVKEQAVQYKTNENDVIEKALVYYFKKKGII